MKLKFENADEVAREFTDAPNKINATVKKTMREVGRPSLSRIKASVKSSVRRLTKLKIKGSSRIDLLIGIFGKEGSRISFDYFKFYWYTYGTLANRDKAHKFEFQRKRKSANWRGGIRPNKSAAELIDREVNTIVNGLKSKLQ